MAAGGAPGSGGSLIDSPTSKPHMRSGRRYRLLWVPAGAGTTVKCSTRSDHARSQMPAPRIPGGHHHPTTSAGLPGAQKKAARSGGLTRRTGGMVAARNLASARGALLGEVADLFEALGDPLLNDVEGLGIGLGDELGQLAGIGDALLESVLRHLDILGDLLLGGGRLRPGAQRYRGLVHRLPRQLDLPAGNSLHTLNRQLIGLRECLEVLALRGHQRFHVETGKSEAGKGLPEIHVKKGLLAVDRHRLCPSKGCSIMLHCTINEICCYGCARSRGDTKNIAVQTPVSRRWHRRHPRPCRLCPTRIARAAGGGQGPPWFLPNRRCHRRGSRATPKSRDRPGAARATRPASRRRKCLRLRASRPSS